MGKDSQSMNGDTDDVPGSREVSQGEEMSSRGDGRGKRKVIARALDDAAEDDVEEEATGGSLEALEEGSLDALEDALEEALGEALEQKLGQEQAPATLEEKVDGVSDKKVDKHIEEQIFDPEKERGDALQEEAVGGLDEEEEVDDLE